MAGYKAVGVVFVRRMIRAAAPEVQLAVTRALTPDELAIYQTCNATDWVPIEIITKMSVASAPLLYPHDDDPLKRVGRELARDNFTGVYSFLVRFLTVPFLIQQTAKLWRTYHQAGEGRSTRVSENEVNFEVLGYPDLPERFRHQTAGFVQEAVSMTGVSNVVVNKTDDDPQCWRWNIRWT